MPVSNAPLTMQKNTGIDSSSSAAFSEIAPKIAALCEDWNEAEKCVKEGELFNKDAVMPSINELRYAGRRLVDACAAAQNGDMRAADAHLLEAGENLTKARHDVADSVIGYISERASDIREQVGASALKKNFSGYENLFGTLKNASRQILLSRKDRTRRNEIYGGIMRNEFPVLRELYDSLEASLPAIEQNIAKDRNELLITRAFAGLGLTAAIILLVARLFG